MIGLGRIEIKQGPSGNQKGTWYFRIIGRNGRVICISEGYTSEAKARHGIKVAFASFIGYFCRFTRSDLRPSGRR